MNYKLIRIYGIVQGIGFRPFIKRLADRMDIKGTVRNLGSFVEIFAVSPEEEKLSSFLDLIPKELPPRAIVKRIELYESGSINQSPNEFNIIESEKKSGDIYISPDISICASCAKELFDKFNRRYLHPFINCTDCGPRLTILKGLPYDRVRTSMADFPMCEKCKNEYYSPDSRRFDAQPVCCPNCGPKVYLLTKDRNGRFERDKNGLEAIKITQDIIMKGGIAAIKGIGGFHLCCNAKDPDAVKRLRERKHRLNKPFAVMMRDIETVKRYCVLSEEEKRILSGVEKPIILLKRKKEQDNGNKSKLSALVSNGSNRIGVMLPYAPLHLLLFSNLLHESNEENKNFEMTEALVMTSGNDTNSPICKTEKEATQKLYDISDCILSNDRDILIRADDSVTFCIENEQYMIRRSRGYVPLPVTINQLKANTCSLGIGGDLKNTFCVSKGEDFFFSPHIGDLLESDNEDAMYESLHDYLRLFNIKPEIIVADKHPSYHSADLAKRIADEWGIEYVQIQHHYAHALSCMGENNWTSACLALCLDGTGYGEDGTIWGGEILKCDLKGFERLGSFEPFWQSGGDSSAKEGWKAAYSMLTDAPSLQGIFALSNSDLLRKAISSRINGSLSTSAGRYFDAAAAVLGYGKSSSYEGECAVRLEEAAERYEKKNRDSRLEIISGLRDLQPQIGKDGFFTIPSLRLIIAIAEESQKLKTDDHENRERLSFIFHRCLANLCIEALEVAAKDTGLNTVALSGGCFQNALFLRLIKRGLSKRGLKALTNRKVPSNDGGIALGQALFGASFKA